MKSLSKTKLAEGLADLASGAIASDNHESPFYQFHEDCVAELKSEKENIELKSDNVVNLPVKKKIVISDVTTECYNKPTFVCPMCKDDPCVWTSVGREAHPTVLAYIEENGGLECLTNTKIRYFYYCKVTKELHGYLGSSNCHCLPK